MRYIHPANHYICLSLMNRIIIASIEAVSNFKKVVQDISRLNLTAKIGISNFARLMKIR